jgi:hypothetical protein
MPSGTRAETALSEWRRAERDLRAADPLTDEAARLTDEVELRRAKYHAITDISGAGAPPADTDPPGQTETTAMNRRDLQRERLIGDGRRDEEIDGG